MKSRVRKSKQKVVVKKIRRRVICIGSFVALVLVFLIVFNKPVMRQAVEGMSITRSLYEQATIQLPSVNGAVAYNIYYKQATDQAFIHSVRKIPVTVPFYTISYLKRGNEYQYRISAVNSSGSEFWWSPITNASDIQPM